MPWPLYPGGRSLITPFKHRLLGAKTGLDISDMRRTLALARH